MKFGENFLLALILGCEIAFWIVLFSGLAVRYLLKWRRFGAILLASVPLIDLILLAATIFDLRNGATATFAHGLAAAYIGFTVAFGSLTIRWADSWFAHKFQNALPPRKAPSYGLPGLVYELKLWARCILAAVVTYILLYLAIFFVNQPERTEALENWLRIPLGTVIFWFIFGPLWSAVFIWRKPKEKVP